MLNSSTCFPTTLRLSYRGSHSHHISKTTLSTPPPLNRNSNTRTYSYITSNIRQKRHTYFHFLDLSKAFDTIDHNIVYIKLRHYGINWVPLNWLMNYLTGRQQFVKLDDEISNTLPISTGVPQGSILGPLLFILYINDLHMASDKFKAILYADDTTLVSTVSAFKRHIEDKNRKRPL